MGTRGLYCIWYKGRCVRAKYNHWDSYPEVLGRTLFLGLKKRSTWSKVRAIGEAKLAQLAAPHDCSTEGCNANGDDDRDDERVGKCPVVTERALQSDLEFLTDGLWCEWVYVLDVDQEVFEVYKGSYSKPAAKTEGHRFADVGGKEATLPNMAGTFGKEAFETMSGDEFVTEVLKACEKFKDEESDE